ncbi:uncharacterized protein LOC129644008 [Bubalus kerabau]|uniref:uncharacterized protein LOC129644008 n=1 Tax=Bubalus carabanensis TaxID=3119969 RepID=UPI00244E93C4|nr:uncharacterized protein LOC129644008 [Bubalus carabanensis]
MWAGFLKCWHFLRELEMNTELGRIIALQNFIGFCQTFVTVYLLDLQVGVPDMAHMELCGPFQLWIFTSILAVMRQYSLHSTFAWTISYKNIS